MLHGLLNGWYETGVKKPFAQAIAMRNRLIRKGMIDPWEGSDEFIRGFKPAIDLIAHRISNFDVEIVRSRFNLETGKVELYRRYSCDIVAEVEIFAEGSGYRVIARVSPELPEHLKEFFELALLARIDFKA